MARVLLVEDNADLAAGIRYNLEIEGYHVLLAEDGRTAIAVARTERPDLVILDLMLPELDGFEVLRTLRGDGIIVPVLVLTARGEEADKVRAFRLDADQYLTKPFGLMELLERVRMLLRRARATPHLRLEGGPRTLEMGEVRVDLGARRVTRGGAEVPLTPKAYALLVALLERPGEVHSRQELLRTVWGHRGAVLTRTVDSHVAELRRKLEEDPENPRYIHTVWKVGYRLEA
jgi:two-component system, OmpR family, alkaline phosphatase synthesis response regulator PhoP